MRGVVADPALAANSIPTFLRARTIWHTCILLAAMQAALRDSQRRLIKATPSWALARGPAAAMAATISRCGWHVAFGTVLVLAEGRSVLLDVDPRPSFSKTLSRRPEDGGRVTSEECVVDMGTADTRCYNGCYHGRGWREETQCD